MTTETTSFPDSVVVVRDVEYGNVDGRSLTLNILRPRTRRATVLPAVVWVHGGWWHSGDPLLRSERLLPLVEQDFFVAAIRYRFSREALFPAQIEDCKCAIRYLRAHAGQYGIDPERIGAWGASAGGHLSALLATSAKASDLEGKGGWPVYSSGVQAAVDWYGPTDLLQTGSTHDTPDSPGFQLIGGRVQDNRDKAARVNPITYLSKDCPPMLIMHGTEDEAVPPSQSDLLYAALHKTGVESELVMVPGKGHEHLGDEATEKVYAFFKRHLQPD